MGLTFVKPRECEMSHSGARPIVARGVGIEPTKDGVGDLPVPSTPRLFPFQCHSLKVNEASLYA